MSICGWGEGDVLTFRGGGISAKERDLQRGWYLCIKGIGRREFEDRK